MSEAPDDAAEVFDVVIVGSGAGGGPLAANLAESGLHVLLLEAGGRAEGDTYQVPAFHAEATEDPALRWDYFVDHFSDPAQAAREEKHVDGKGVLYPRAGTLGGCTAHHALITVYPHNGDWDDIAAATGDRSWRSGPMRRYFQRMERCQYRPRPKVLPGNRWLAALLEALPFVSDRYVNRSRHGFDGWLPTNLADPKLVARDWQLLKILLAAAEDSLADLLRRPLSPLEGLGGLTDPNDWRAVSAGAQGLWLVPLSVGDGKRYGARDRVRVVAERLPGRLVVRTGALATRVLLDDSLTATGVEYLAEERAYRAGPGASQGGPLPPTRVVRARYDVVLSAGAFNTPQLLMLSGIGPPAELQRHGVPLRVDRAGVGANLQDRYEVGVVSEMEDRFALLGEGRFRPRLPGEEPDAFYRDWQQGRGVYTTNGAVLALIRASRSGLAAPDLFTFGLPADFRGYYPGYSDHLTRSRDRWTWAILKAHTANTGGRVRLRSSDPRDVPQVDFHYFEEGTDSAGEDLDAVVRGIELARAVNARADGVIRRELFPGPDVRTREELRTFVRDNAWGHHASCTAKMGPASDPMAVVDSRFRVHGTRNLRVVDTSVFPRIPGFFIVTPTYMISEKASDVVLADARAAGFRPARAVADRVRPRIVAAPG